MPKGKVTINGDMIDLGSVRLFNQKEKTNKKDGNCKDYGIEFIFYSGARKTVW